MNNFPAKKQEKLPQKTTQFPSAIIIHLRVEPNSLSSNDHRPVEKGEPLRMKISSREMGKTSKQKPPGKPLPQTIHRVAQRRDELCDSKNLCFSPFRGRGNEGCCVVTDTRAPERTHVDVVGEFGNPFFFCFRNFSRYGMKWAKN